MSSEPDWVFSLIVSWLPFLVLVGTCMYCARQVKRGLSTSDGRPLGDVLAELAMELRRQSEKPQ